MRITKEVESKMAIDHVLVGSVVESVDSTAIYLIIEDNLIDKDLQLDWADKVCVLNLIRNEVQYVNRLTSVYVYPDVELILGVRDTVV